MARNSNYVLKKQVRRNTKMINSIRQAELLAHKRLKMRKLIHELAHRYIIQKVWEKAAIVPGIDPQVWRLDQCGAWINRYEYGNRQSWCGWEKDHITPVSVGGTNYLSNLRPLHWHNNASRQARCLTCSITAAGAFNVPVASYSPRVQAARRIASKYLSR